MFDVSVDQVLREVCLEIEKRYQIKFLEIGTDEDHVHFLVQSVPTYSVTKIVTTIIKCYGSSNIQTVSTGQETIMGWRILD